MKTLSKETRHALGGSSVELSKGVTHYFVEGPDDGSPLVAIHGASVPCWQFDLLLPVLHRCGFRTLRFDLYGHGFSDRPPLAYTLELFTNQTLEVITAVKFPVPAVILGHSLGAAIAAAVALSLPLDCKPVLSAPLLDFSGTNPLSGLLRLPLIGEIVMRGFGLPALARRRRRRYSAIGRPELAQRFNQQAAYKGFWEALLSMERCDTLGDQSGRYNALGQNGRDVLIVWSNRDRIVPAAHIDRIRQMIPNHHYTELDGMEHNHLLTAPDQIGAAIVNFARPYHHY